jgi:hypothetical protein
MKLLRDRFLLGALIRWGGVRLFGSVWLSWAWSERIPGSSSWADRRGLMLEWGAGGQRVLWIKEGC